MGLHLNNRFLLMITLTCVISEWLYILSLTGSAWGTLLSLHEVTSLSGLVLLLSLKSLALQATI